jgi:hypothetical protein
MEENYDYLIEILEASVEKNGEKPLTNKWLLNILKIVRQKIEQEDNAMGCGFDPNWD